MDKEKLFEDYKYSRMKIQMKNTYLEDVTIEKENEELEGDYINEITFQKKIELKEESSAKGYLRTQVKSRNLETDEVDVHIEVTYSGVFYSDDYMEPTALERWVDIQLVPQLLSYNRSLITSLTSQMDIEPINLPTVDVLESIGKNMPEETGEK
ncbi:protein-export chaperone SecB [Halobacillus halophilus]|uniref:protein-export chaperone SecB n=1 Tax=Halobacillus halophilus TaxID=1570 RepID=UPI001CD6FF52|nr:protein-export chaperone SecB [Halobacillus halophilus]MCA1010375.1 protein-export chaperone SecB [Halobacillus halophilus]